MQDAVKELGNGKSFADLSGPEQSQVMQRAQAIKAARNGNATSPITNLVDAAQSLRTEAQPVFRKLDELTADRDMKFSDWQKEERAADRRGDYQAQKKARDAQQQIVDEFTDEFAPADLQNARALWRQSGALQDVHDALKSRGVNGPTPVEFRPVGGDDPGYIKAKPLSDTIRLLKDDGLLRQAGLTPAHVQSLQDLGTLLEKGENVHKLGKLMTTGGAMLEGDFLINHPAAALKMAKAGVGAVGVSKFLGRVMMDQKFAQGVRFLRTVQRTAPAVSAQVTRNALEGARSALGGPAAQ